MLLQLLWRFCSLEKKNGRFTDFIPGQNTTESTLFMFLFFKAQKETLKSLSETE